MPQSVAVPLSGAPPKAASAPIRASATDKDWLDARWEELSRYRQTLTKSS